MESIQTEIKSYDAKKLKEIVEKQADAYGDFFLQLAKDELIKRGENFSFDAQVVEEIQSLDDASLQELVEDNWQGYHLEYMECARREFLNRGLKISHDNRAVLRPIYDSQASYPILRSIIRILKGLAVLVVILPFLGLVFSFYRFALPFFLYGLLVGISLFAFAELLKVILKIEENTRK